MACSLGYTTSITGDCLNKGEGGFTISITGSAPDYSVNWISPFTGLVPLGPGVTDYTQSGLEGGTYIFEIIDSCEPPTIQPVSIHISTGTCVSITGQINTVCGLDNGSLTATTSNVYSTATFSLYEFNSGFITSGASFGDSYSFGSLSAGTYYVIADDGGGCTGKSETCIIKDSDPLDFNFYVINNAGCAVNSGAIYITGLTGTPPYTYLWAPYGQTTSSITGLTGGSYNVTITDGSGCVMTKGTTVVTVPHIGLGAFTVVNPSCFKSDGEVTVTITGGTAPFYYSGSNGTVEVSFATSYTFTGVAAGTFFVQVTDAGLCNFTSSTTLLTPGGLTVTSVSTTNSLCNNSGGSLSVNVFGGSPPYTYTLTDSLSNSTVVSGSFTNWIFNGLSSGTYTLTISDKGPCVFEQEYVINNTVLFELTVEPQGTTCNNSDGLVTLNITPGGVGPFHYQIDGESVFSSDYTYSFYGLSSGNYTATVTDSNNCTQTVPFTINSSDTVDFVLVGTDSTNGTNGTISAFITTGEPPFTLYWSPNVNGQTGLNINTLSAGTYTLTVVDSNGCSQTRDIVINGFNVLTSYQTFNICDDDFMNTGQTIRKGPQQMLTEGFHDLTSGDTNCVLHQTIFYAEVTVNGDTQTHPFYTGTTLTDYPSDSLFYEVVKEILTSYDGIGEVILDYLDNKITINTDCNSSVSLTDANVKIALKISYDIACETCGNACHCYEISGPKGCVVTYVDCDSEQKTTILPGTNNIRICSKEILDIICENSCTNPYDYFFKIVEETALYDYNNGDYETFTDSYLINLEKYLQLGLVISNATNEVCCPNCNGDQFYGFGSLGNIVSLYDIVGYPNCCNSISGGTKPIDEYTSQMVKIFGQVPSNCQNGFTSCLDQVKTTIGDLNIQYILEGYGIGETGFVNSNSILCYLSNILSNLVSIYSFDEDFLSKIFELIVSDGFIVECKQNTIYLGGLSSFEGFDTYLNSVTYPPVECPQPTYTNIAECVDNVCPPIETCMNGLEYFFNQITDTSSFDMYLSQLNELLKSGIEIFNPNLTTPICCPDCDFYFIGSLGPYSKIIDLNYNPNCCVNEYTFTERYIGFLNFFTHIGQNPPRICCNNFEPCLTELTQNGLIYRDIIETSYNNNQSNLCVLNGIITNLPFTLDEQIQILNTILRVGITIWCCYDTVYISGSQNYTRWLNNGGCTGPKICFTITDGKNFSSCPVDPIGIYNGKPYYPATLTDGSCDVYGGYYVYYSVINYRWELGDEPDGGTTVFSYLPVTGTDFPLSYSPSNDWIQVSEIQKLFMLSSISGPCN